MKQSNIAVQIWSMVSRLCYGAIALGQNIESAHKNHSSIPQEISYSNIEILFVYDQI